MQTNILYIGYIKENSKNSLLNQTEIRLHLSRGKIVNNQARPVGAVDNTTAHQASKFQKSVAFQLQQFNPLFTLVFTQITAMEFTVFGNVLSKSRVTLSRKTKSKISLTV